VTKTCGVACGVVPDLRTGIRGVGSDHLPAGLALSITHLVHLKLSKAANQIDDIPNGDSSTSPHATRRRRSGVVIWKGADPRAQPQVMCRGRELQADECECKSAACVCGYIRCGMVLVCVFAVIRLGYTLLAVAAVNQVRGTVCHCGLQSERWGGVHRCALLENTRACTRDSNLVNLATTDSVTTQSHRALHSVEMVASDDEQMYSRK
jgi:hypothetical protein